MTRKFLWFAIAGVLLAGVVLTSTLWAQNEQKKLNPLESMELFNQVLVNVQGQYQRKVETPELIKSAIDGMLSSLDPYSEYMEPADASELRIRTQGEFGGIGIHIGSQEGRLLVIATIEGTPAYRAGIMAGDRFAEIEGKSTEGMTIKDAVGVLRGTPGTNVNVAMAREGVKDLLRHTITREVIKIKAVPYAGKLGEDVGYVRLADFSQSAMPELAAALDSLVSRVKVKKLIFDLRMNGGGLLNEGFEVSQLFLPRGETIVTTAGQTPGSRRVFISNNPSPYLDVPMIVLVDRGSASAAEIVAGALQDWERAVVVGETTFGKGTVQTPIPMPGQATLKLTTALWRTPSGRCVDVRTGRDTAAHKQDSIFHTLGGNARRIKGWSCIIPDVYVPYPKFSDFEAKLRGEWFFDFTVRYAAKHATLKPDFAVSAEMVGEFKTFLKEKKFEFTDAQFDSVRNYVERTIRVQIAGKLWGTYGDYEARLQDDQQVNRAIELLSKAKSQQDLFAALPKEGESKKLEK
jgi:carboxyl-terminal processing protease